MIAILADSPDDGALKETHPAVLVGRHIVLAWVSWDSQCFPWDIACWPHLEDFCGL